MNAVDINELFSVFDEKDGTENNDIHTCTNCNSILGNSTSDGDIVCETCGLVSKSHVMNEGSEWTSFTPGNERCEYNNSTLLHGDNMSTQVGYKRNMKPDDWALIKWQRTIQLSSKDRSLIKVYNRIDECCLKHSITQNIITSTKVLYKFISQKKLTRGDVREAMITSCLFFACIHCDNPRNVLEVSNIMNSKQKKVNKTNKILSIELWKSQWKDLLSYELQSEQLIFRYCSNISLSQKQSADIVKISRELENLPSMIGKDCSYAAAISIYIYSVKNKLEISKDDICETCYLSTVTLNKLIKNQI